MKGLFIGDKLEILYEKIELFRPIIIFIIDAKKNLEINNFINFFDEQNIILFVNGYDINLERFKLFKENNEKE